MTWRSRLGQLQMKYSAVWAQGLSGLWSDAKKPPHWGTLRKEGAPRLLSDSFFGLWDHNPMLAIPLDAVFSLPLHLNVVPAFCFFICVFSLISFWEVSAEYPIQTVIQFYQCLFTFLSMGSEY